MKHEKVINQLIETEYNKKENTEVLDCTNEMEEVIKELLSE